MLLFALYCALATAVLFLPGLLLGAAIGLRRLSLLATAPPLTIGMISVGAVVLSLAGLPFTPLSVAVWSLLCAAGGAMVGAIIRRQRPELTRGPQHSGHERREFFWELGAWALGVLLMIRPLYRTIPKPDVINQGYDNAFHLNALQWVMQHHDGSSLRLLDMTAGEGGGGFYPAAWHDYAGLAGLLRPCDDVSIVANAATYVLLGLAWPLAALFLTRTLLPWSRAALVMTAVLSAGLPAFPLRIVAWGPLYPNLLAMVITPPLLAHLAMLFRGAANRTASWWGAVGSALVATAGITLAHPSEFIVLLLALNPLVIAWAWTERRDRAAATSRLRRSWPTLAAVATALATVGAWVVLRPAAWAAMWDPISLDNWDLALASVADQAMSIPEAAALAAAVIVALGWWAFARAPRLRWYLAFHLVMVFIFCLNFVRPQSTLRYWVSGTWYSDPQRLAALVALTSVTLGAAGASVAAGWAEKRVRPWVASRASSMARPRAWLALTLAAWIAFTWSTMHSGGYAAMARATMLSFSTTYNPSPLIDDDERQMFRDLPAIVPLDERIATTPHNGSSFAYGATGRPTTTTHFNYDPTPDVQKINDGLYAASFDPTVCPAVQRLNVHWALDFGNQEAFPGRHPYPGLDNLRYAQGFTPRLKIGKKVLYHVDVCWS